MIGGVQRAIRLEVSANDFSGQAYESGWTDGLPVVAPTPERVEEMIALSGRGATEVLGLMPPRLGEATIERVAISTVMAGCRPEYLPVVLAAIEAVLDARFNLNAVQSTTHPVGVALVINGPIGPRLSIQSGSGCMGPGWRANMTIGRAARLALINNGGAAPGLVDRATHGFPGKLSLCFAENEADSPWAPFHVDRGYDSTQSTVTAVQAGGTQNVLDQASSHGRDLLATIARSLRAPGSNNAIKGHGELLVVLGPKHARIIASTGFAKSDVRRFLFSQAAVRGGSFPEPLRAMVSRFRGDELGVITKTSRVPMGQDANSILVMVAGGPGNHSVVLPSFGDGAAVTREIRWPIP